MKILAILALIWICVLMIGSALGILGKLIWLGLLLTIASVLWNYLHNKR